MLRIIVDLILRSFFAILLILFCYIVYSNYKHARSGETYVFKDLDNDVSFEISGDRFITLNDETTLTIMNRFQKRNEEIQKTRLKQEYEYKKNICQKAVGIYRNNEFIVSKNNHIVNTRIVEPRTQYYLKRVYKKGIFYADYIQKEDTRYGRGDIEIININPQVKQRKEIIKDEIIKIRDSKKTNWENVLFYVEDKLDDKKVADGEYCIKKTDEEIKKIDEEYKIKLKELENSIKKDKERKKEEKEEKYYFGKKILIGTMKNGKFIQLNEDLEERGYYTYFYRKGELVYTEFEKEEVRKNENRIIISTEDFYKKYVTKKITTKEERPALRESSFKERENNTDFSLRNFILGKKTYICEFGKKAKYKNVEDTYCANILASYGIASLTRIKNTYSNKLFENKKKKEEDEE